jgi:hypothetical protein
MDIAETIQRHREKLKLFTYFAVMLAVAGPLAVTLGEAWERATLSQSFTYMLYAFLSVTLEQFATVMFGLFLGLLGLMTLDPKKRWQGILLWLGLAVALVGLQAQGLFLPNIDFLQTAPWLVGGVAVGVLAGGGRRLVNIQTAEAMEFRRAASGIFYLLTVVIVVALLEYHLVYPQILDISQSGVSLTELSGGVGIAQQGLVWNVALSGVFVYTLGQFIQYDAEQNFFVLGPPASGKSLFLIGGYLEALEQARNRDDQTPMNPSDDLMSYVEQLDMDTSDWIVEATARGQMHYLAFRYVHGTIFPRNIQIASLDYAGEYLDRLPDALTGLLENESDETLLALAENVLQADTLILILDVERYANNEPLDISEYFSILQATDETDVLLVATKADILAEQFREERGIEAHRYYGDFKEYVNQKLSGNQQVRALIEETTGADIHPVYYQTTEAEVGDGRVPMRDENNSVMTVGFDRLLERLGK